MQSNTVWSGTEYITRLLSDSNFIAGGTHKFYFTDITWHAYIHDVWYVWCIHIVHDRCFVAVIPSARRGEAETPINYNDNYLIVEYPYT